jgi:hypothetical protein
VEVRYSPEQRKAIAAQARGNVVRDLEWSEETDETDGYWVMTFEDNTELCFRLMAELVNR